MIIGTKVGFLLYSCVFHIIIANSLLHLHAHLISFMLFDDGDAHYELRLVFEAASMYVIQYSHRSVATSGVARIIDFTTAFQ